MQSLWRGPESPVLKGRRDVSAVQLKAVPLLLFSSSVKYLEIVINLAKKLVSFVGQKQHLPFDLNSLTIH